MSLSRLYFKKFREYGISPGDRLIKVFATTEDPRMLYSKESLAVVQMNGEPFTDTEQFFYKGRGLYTGEILECELAIRGHTEGAKEVIRALMRFANIPELGFCQRAMEARLPTGEWLIPHPFEDLHGADNPRRPEGDIHLDIFYPDSLKAIKTVVDYHRAELVMGAREGRAYSKGKER